MSKTFCQIYFIQCIANEFGYGSCGIIQEKCHNTIPWQDFSKQCPTHGNNKCFHHDRAVDACCEKKCPVPDSCNFDEIDALYY
jgi:hypothetical protein